jgi:hypothetical protein
MEPDKSAPRWKSPALWVMVFVYGLLMLIYGRIVIESDGITYYALTQSLIQDHDFDLQNQYEKMPEVRVFPSSITGKLASVYSCGIAILNGPFVWVSNQLGRLLPALSQWRPYAQSVRFPFPDTLGVFLASSVYSFVAILICAALLVRQYQASTAIAAFLPMAVFIGTPLAFYTFCSPSFIHAADAFLVAAAFYFAVMETPMSINIRLRNLLIGFFLALAILVRNNDIVLILPIVGGVVWYERKNGWKRAFFTALEILAGALPVLIIHIYFNLTQYGRPFMTGYRIDFSKDFSRRITTFHMIFTNPSAGMFPWAPVTVLSLIGLIVGTIRKRRSAILALASVVTVIASIRFAGFVWTFGSFGQRYVVHLLIFFVVGLYELVLISKKGTLVLTGLCVFWSFLLWNAYLINFASPELRGTLTIQYGRALTPVQLLQNTKSKYDKANNSASMNPFSFCWNSLGKRPYPTLIHILTSDPDSSMEKPAKRERPRKN